MTAHNADDIRHAMAAAGEVFGTMDDSGQAEHFIEVVIGAVSDRIAAREREACAKQVEGAGYPDAAKCIRLHSEYGRAADLGEPGA